MMDQLISAQSNAPQTEHRDAGKARSDRPERDGKGFNDALSSVNKAPSNAASSDQASSQSVGANEAPHNDAPEGADAQQANPATTEPRVKIRKDLPFNPLHDRIKNIAQDQRADGKMTPAGNGRAKDSVQDVAKRAAQGLLRQSIDAEKLKDLKQSDKELPIQNTLVDIVEQLSLSAEAAANVSQTGKDVGAGKDGKEAKRLLDVSKQSALLDGKRTVDEAGAGTSDGIDFAEGADAIYRFNSAKGEGLRSLDMAVRNGDGRVDFEVRGGNDRITENVTVLDSRRFLGLATPTNATSIASLIASDSEWMSAMRPESALLNAAAQSSTGKVVHTLKLQLTPIDLGSVTMSLRMVGDELAVHMTVENAAAYRRLQDDNRGMMEALKAHGITVDQITVSVSSSEKSDQLAGQQQGQGTGANLNGNANANGQGKEGQSEHSSDVDLGGSHVHSDEISGGSSASSGDVYI